MSLIFDRASHTYTLDGRVLESVTETLQGAGAIDPSYFTVVSRIRGTKAHMACALLESPGGLKWSSLKAIEEMLGEPIEGYVRSWERFLKESDWISEQIEVPMYHPDYLYAGTPDRTGTWGGARPSILDLKTGAPLPAYGLQNAGYEKMARRIDGISRHRFSVHLRADGGKPGLELHTEPGDGQTFLCMLETYRWRKRHGYRIPTEI